MKLFYACSALILSALTLDASAQARPAKRVVRHGQHTIVAGGELRGGGPANDVCTDAPSHALAIGVPTVITGTNEGATLDDPPLTDNDQNEFPAVWESITVPSCMDITLSYCGSEFEGTVFTGLFTDCDFTGIVRAFSTETTTCPDGFFTMTYRRIPAGTYLIPVALDPAGTAGAYTISVLGMACSDPAVANDECAGGVELTPGSSCNEVTADVTGATQSMPAATCNGFTGTADEDVWFSFEATSTTAQISVQASEGFDAVLEVFEGSCAELESLGCADETLDGGVETTQVTDLVVGNTYYARVYDWYVGLPPTTEISVCVVEIPDVATNDDCPGTSLTMGATCVPTSGTVAGATQSIPAIICNNFQGSADDDVWHSFVATSTNVVVAALGGTDFDMVLELLSGPCGSPTSLACSDTSVANEIEELVYGGLTVGTTYYVRIYSYDEGPLTDPTYQVCVVGVEPPANDRCADAIVVDVNEPMECPAASVMGSNAFAEVSTDDPECDASTVGYQDVWYSFNSLGNSSITFELTNISMSDAGVEILAGCGGTSVFCDLGEGVDGPIDVDVDPNTDYLVRVYSNSQFGEGGDFGLCVSGAISTAVIGTEATTWKVFPNPNNGTFQISNAGEAMNGTVQLFDATGRLVVTERVVLPAGGIQTLDHAGHLAPGTYSLRMIHGDVRTEQRVLVH
jgi:hypothetical protein